MVELGMEGTDELIRVLQELPQELQSKVMRAWAARYAREVASAARAAAPLGKTGNLRKGIVARNARPSRLKAIGSLARSVTIGKSPAFHFHWFNRGTKARWTKGGTSRGAGGKYAKASRIQRSLGKAAYRGIMPANNFLERAARPIQERAKSDLNSGLAREVQRVLQAAMRRTMRRGGG